MLYGNAHSELVDQIRATAAKLFQSFQVCVVCNATRRGASFVSDLPPTRVRLVGVRAYGCKREFSEYAWLGRHNTRACVTRMQAQAIL